ncbi:hypothetical protein BESB_004140 [Besnoitia besnoiti]|uniref:Uncharacterized protein n=1 Tax=Besnoitia besnoiti TaxID=94643 RepID=A0A2A9MPQ6_BESBE|nr:hypothetical protein BESB_004140 [Besnoitia besnoiti]PFH38073.1 hypothetical protein BESB_004140 [Besnoitia besnoiti]
MVISSLLSLGVRPSPPFLAAACCYVSVYTSHLPPQALVLIAYNISRVLSAAPTRRAFAPLVHAESASPEEEELASDAGVFRLLLTPSISLSYGYSGPSARATPDVGTSFSHRCPPASSSTSGASGSSLSRVPRAPSSLAPSSAMSPPPDDPREIRFVSPLQLLVAALISGMEAKSARLKAVDWCCGLQALESLLPLASAPASAQGALRASWPPVRTTPSGAGHPGHAPRSAAALEGDAAAGGTGGASALERSWSSSSPCGSHSASLSTASCPPPAATASREDVWPGSRSFGVSPVSWDLLWTASDLAAGEAALRGGLAPLLVESSEESSSERLLRALQSLLTLLPPQVHGLPANSLSNTALAVARLHRTCASLLGAHPFRRPPSSMDVLEGGTADMPRRSTDGHDRVCGSLNDRPGHGTCESACDGGLRVSVSATLSAVYSQLCRRTLQACRERRGLPPVSCVILLSSLADGLRTLQNAPSSISLATATSAVHPLSLDAASPSHSFPRGLPEASSAASTAESGLEEEVLAVFTAAAPHLLSPAGVSAATPSSPPGFASSAPTSTGAALPRAILPRGGCHAAADEDASTPRGQSLRLAWDPKPRDLVDLVGALSFMLLRRRAGRQAVGEQDLCSLGASGVLPPSPSQAASSLRDLQRLLSACTTHVLEALPSAPPRAPSSSPCGFVGRPSSESFGRQQRPFLSARDLSTIALHLRRCGALAPELFRGFSRFLADRSGHRLLSGTDFCCFLHALVCLELPAAPPAREREPEVARETLGEARGVRALSSGTQLAPPSGQSKAEGAPSPAQAERSKADAALTREAARVSVHLLDGALPATIASFDSRALSSFALWLGQHFQLLQLYDLTAPPAPVSLGSPRKAPASGFAEPSRAAAPASAASSFAVAETSGLASVAHRSSPPTLSLLATRGQLERSADLLLREVGRRCASSPHLLRDSPRHLAPSEHSQSFDLFRSIVDPQSGSTTASTPPLFQDGRSYTALLCGICKLPRSIITSSLCLPVATAPRSGEAPSESSAAADASSHADPAAASSSPWRSRSSSFSAAPPVEAAAGSWNLTLQPVQTGNARTADTSGEPRLSSAVPPHGDWPDVLRILLDPSRVKAFLSCSRTTDAEFADILWAIRHLPLLPVANAPSSLLLPSTPSPPSVHAVSPTASAEKDSLFFGLPELRQNLVDIALQTLEGGKGATGCLPLSSASRLNLRSSPSAQPSQALPPVPREVSARMERLRQDPEILSRVFFYLVSLGATSASVLGLFYPALLTCLASVSRTQAVVPASRGSQRNTIDATLLSPASLKLTACILSALRAFPSSSRLLREQKVALCAAALSFLTASSSSLSASLARASARVPGASQGLSERPDSPPAGLLGSADYGQMVEASLSAAAELRVNQPAEAIHALSESFLAWALTQASSRPLGTSQERGTEERGAAVAPWAPLAVRCAVALRSLDFPSASFLLRLLPPLVDSLSAPLGAVSEGSKRRQAALRDRVSQAACAGFAPARQLGTGLLHSPESSAALSRAAAFSQLSQLLLCVVCAAGSHVQREAERREKRQRGEGGQENAERSPYGCRDSSLVRELYFGKATRELLRTLLILYRSPQGAHASESQRRLDFLSILHILKDALLLALPLEAGPLRLMHALSTEVASGGGSLDPSLREALPSAAGRSAREDGERASASQDEKVAYAELWDLEACTAGSSAERPESSVLHKEVLTVTQRLLHHGQLPLEAGTKGTSFRRADGERSSGVHSIQWSLENAQRPQDGDCDADWKIVSEHRLGRLYYLDILISRRTGV